MRKILVLASVLTLLGAGSAMAQDFKPSSHSAFPVTGSHSQQHTGSVDRGVTTSSVGTAGFSAADGFGTNDQSSLPAPRFQLQAQNGGHQNLTTSSTGAHKAYHGYNAADSFEASY